LASSTCPAELAEDEEDALSGGENCDDAADGNEAVRASLVGVGCGDLAEVDEKNCQ
jgi:hypothetical protein